MSTYPRTTLCSTGFKKVLLELEVGAVANVRSEIIAVNGVGGNGDGSRRSLIVLRQTRNGTTRRHRFLRYLVCVHFEPGRLGSRFWTGRRILVALLSRLTAELFCSPSGSVCLDKARLLGWWHCLVRYASVARKGCPSQVFSQWLQRRCAP